MTAPINDGGQAFPVSDTMHASGHDGMSLRDWFAGQASETDIAMHRGSWVADEKPPYTREEAKYRYADAMLAARTKGGEQ